MHRCFDLNVFNFSMIQDVGPLMQNLSSPPILNICSFNQAKPKTETEAKLYEVLSHENWGSSSTLLNEIARETYDYDKFGIISTVMWESMENQRPAAWRVVFKGLTLLEHLIKNGSERCVDDARNHGHSLRALQQFNYYEGTIDRGQGVREKAKQLIDTLGDDERVREERMKARKLREKFGGGSLGGVSGGNRGGYGGSGGGGGGYGNESSWESGGGYANGGIDAASRQRRGNSGYGGRYDDDRDTRATTAGSTGPTFATLPPTSESTKTKKKKKKKQQHSEDASAAEIAAPPPAPPADLLDFGGEAPAPAIATTANDEDDDGFGNLRSGQSAPYAAQDPFATPAANDPGVSDEFGAFDSAPAASSGGDPFAQQQQQQSSMPASGGFDAFGGGMAAMNPNMGNNNMGNNMNPMMQLQTGMAGMNMMGGRSMQQQQQQQPNNANIMGGGTAPQQPRNSQNAAAPADDDEFGAFEDAGAGGGGVTVTAVAGSSASSADPLNKLISLDGLTKNEPKKKPNKPSEDVAAADPAASGFGSGFDSMGGGAMNNTMVTGMGTSGGSSAIAMMDPAMMGLSSGQPQKQQQQPQQQQQGGMGMGMQGGGGAMGGGMMGMGMQGGGAMGSTMNAMQGGGGAMGSGGMMNNQMMMGGRQ